MLIKRFLKNTVLLIAILQIIISCNSSSKEISFYHWKTNLNLDDTEVLLLKETNATKLYSKFFDISWVEIENKAYPKATIQFRRIDTTLIKDIVPVIYITNEVFENTIAENDIKDLSIQVVEKIKRLYESNLKKDFLIEEVQFDCDWTQNTKDAYFKFLKQIRNTNAYQELGRPLISATIRLHQIKYKRKTGVPPIDKAVIMFYNTGRVFDIEEQNSVLSVLEVDKYVQNLQEYPLVYDVALPVFSWAVVFRNNTFVGLINNVTKRDLNEDFEYKNGFYEPKKTTVLGSTFLSMGDKVRLEEPTIKELIMLTKLIKRKSAIENYGIIYYHISSDLVKNLGSHSLQKLAQ